jgi:general secretion pathway protein C
VLLGVLADRQQGGAALIAVDGKAAKPYRVGATVDGNLVLQSVAGRHAVLAESVDGPAQITLELPPLSK